jgi:hypothetical protein
MKRAILAVAAGLVLWIMLISVLNRGLRLLVAGYAAAEPTLSFTLGMLMARLLIAALTSLIAGALVRWLAPASVRAPLLLGIILLIAFIPIHVQRWSLFPFWYHTVFLVTLIPLVVLGSRLRRARGSIAGAPAGGAHP